MQFKGTNSPELYIIDYHDEDITEQYPLSGQRGSFVTSLLGSMSLLDKVRIANQKIQGDNVVISDILQTRPKVIIGFGGELLKYYVSTTNKTITNASGEIYDLNIGSPDNNFETKYLALVSPSYVLRQIDNQDISLKFSQDLYKAFQIINGDYVDILKAKNILSARTFEEFVNIYNQYLKDDTELAYDIETNARPPMMEGSKIIGFSLANKTTGVYVSIDSLDYQMPQNDEDAIWHYLINEIFEKEDKLIIHNTMYERPYTAYCKGYNISFDKAHDTLVMARLLRNPRETAGLKYQAQKNLHYPDWETDLITYITIIKAFIERIGLGPKKFANIYNELKTISSIFELPKTKAFIELDKNDQEEITEYLDKLNSILVDLYDKNELYELGLLIARKIIEIVEQGGIQDDTLPYNDIPDRLLRKYGAVDSLATYDLKEYFFKLMDENSTERVDLHKGYQNWLEHMYVAYIMERNGMYWNDALAERDRQILVDKATDALKECLNSPCFKPYVEANCSKKYNPIIFSDYMPWIPESQNFTVEYDNITGKYTVKLDGKRVNKDRINDILIFPTYRKQYEQILYQLFYEDIENAISYEELKEIYNPASITSNHIPRAILIDKNLQMGGRITELHTLSISPSFEKVKDKLPAIDQKFLQIATYCCDVDLLKDQYGDQWADQRKFFYDGFCKLYDQACNMVTTPEIKNILFNKEPVQIETFDDNGIITIFNNMVVQGIDPDNENTWTPKFKWLVNFRIFKKAAKIISTYIDGSTGHEAVAVVDAEELRKGNPLVTRKRRFNKGRAKSGEDYLLMSKWAPNTAETGRWRSAFHTLPWTSPVKKYYESRFIGGCTVCPDYSAMEVRSLAAISQDVNMLKLFNNDEDFHTITASSIFRKPKDEITPTERRFSKTGTFSILYGSTVESFANKYCNGDISYAKQIYDGFYNTYPGAKKWMDERHEEVLKEHRVSLELSNRFISITPQDDSRGEINSMLRRSVNYPIQGQSADITGCVMFDLQKYIEEHNMKSLIFMYVHDSIEVDIYPYEMFEFIEYLKYLLNEAPMRRMGLISKAEVALGKSLGDEIELVDLEISEDKTSGTMTLKGYKDEIDETVANWKKAYKTVEVSDEEYKDIYISMNELFMAKKAYSPLIGTHRQKGTCKVYIDYYN